MNEKGINLDFIDGRTVKLRIDKKEDGYWKIHASDLELKPELQSWSIVYPTFERLLDSAEIIKLGE